MRMGRSWMVVLLPVLLWPRIAAAQDGRLERIREDVTHSGSGGSDRKDESGGKGGSDDEDPGAELLAMLLGPPLLYAAASPFLIPRAILEDPSDADARF